MSNNDFLMQCVADIIQKKLYRPHSVSMTSRGAAFAAGIGAGVWKSLDELKQLSMPESVVTPQDNWDYYRLVIQDWERAVRRAKLWSLE